MVPWSLANFLTIEQLINKWVVNNAWLGQGYGSWKVRLFKEKLMEIEPVLEDITKAGLVFILDPLIRVEGIY